MTDYQASGTYRGGWNGGGQCGYDKQMILQRIVFSLGVVAVIVGVAGLVVPVSVSPDRQHVGCGSAVWPDLSEAKKHDDNSAANIPVPGGVVTDTNYTRLCRKDLEDRRLWTVTLAIAGLVAVGGVLALRFKRSRSTS
jgi:hypothetical protein